MGEIKVESNCGQPIEIISVKDGEEKVIAQLEPSKNKFDGDSSCYVINVDKVNLGSNHYWHPNYLKIQTKTKFGDKK